MPVPRPILTEIADEVERTRGVPIEISPFTSRYPGFGLEDAYWVVEELRRRREAQGECVIGRKIGFTNASAWTGYGITGPIWNYLYDRTTLELEEHSALAIGHWPNVRMEVEVALGLAAAPNTRMDDEQLLACVDWAGLDFEVCTSVFPDWRFNVADAAATGVHVGLMLGPKHALNGERKRWSQQLRSFSITLACDNGSSAIGAGAQVLGSPIAALRYLVEELDRFAGLPLKAGDIVTTGTLTAALPAEPGQTWRASPVGIPFQSIAVRLV
jgi:2-oxo-3-hexenedioate decarboxylase